MGTVLGVCATRAPMRLRNRDGKKKFFDIAVSRDELIKNSKNKKVVKLRTLGFTETHPTGCSRLLSETYMNAL